MSLQIIVQGPDQLESFGRQLQRTLRHVRRLKKQSALQVPDAVYNTLKMHVVRVRHLSDDLCQQMQWNTPDTTGKMLGHCATSSANALHQLRNVAERAPTCAPLQRQYAQLVALYVPMRGWLEAPPPAL
jgi:hypothetical protein